jgi:hypothetical protein
MKLRLFSAVVLGLALSAASAQDAPTAPPAGQTPAQAPGAGGWQGGQGQRGGRGGWGSGGGMMGGGRGMIGTVTEAAADHYTIKTDAGETYTVHFSVNTRILKQSVQRQGEGGGGGGPQPIKSTDIKVGDAVAVLGEVDAAAKSVGATVVAQLDPERAKQMREMQANYGKTWLMGKVTAVDGVKVTIMGEVDNAAHTVVADENTTFRKRREPITLADVQVGDMLRVEGAVKDGNFLAASVAVMGMPPGGAPTVPRAAPPASAPQPSVPQPK